MKKQLEVCCGGYSDCIAAQAGQADRVELNSALYLGGLSPNLIDLIEAKKHLDIPVVCMVRPRAAGFCYDKIETDLMTKTTALFLENGADGIVFGFLNSDRSVDAQKTKAMVDLIHSYQKEAIFHRAIDVVENIDTAMQTLIDCGVDRVLTSGQAKNVPLGIPTLAHLQSTYGTSIEILPGCGIQPSNIKEIIDQTGVFQVHSSCKSYQNDPTTWTDSVNYSYYPDALKNSYEIVDVEIVKRMHSLL